MDKPTEEQVQAFINEILSEWIPFALQSIVYQMRNKGLVSSGELTENVIGDYVQANASGQAVATLLFETYGRYLDIKKKLNNRKQMPDEVIKSVLLEWVKRRGIGAFQFVPGYQGKPNISEDRALKRIAWGIGKSMKNYKVTGWRYSKRKTSLVINLTQRLVTSYAEVAQRTIVQGLNDTA